MGQLSGGVQSDLSYEVCLQSQGGGGRQEGDVVLGVQHLSFWAGGVGSVSRISGICRISGQI